MTTGFFEGKSGNFLFYLVPNGKRIEPDAVPFEACDIELVSMFPVDFGAETHGQLDTALPIQLGGLASPELQHGAELRSGQQLRKEEDTCCGSTIHISP